MVGKPFGYQRIIWNIIVVYILRIKQSSVLLWSNALALI